MAEHGELPGGKGFVRKGKAARADSLLRGEHGFTLLETLAAVMMFAMVASILYAFMLMGMSTYKRVTAETQVRQQGDRLVAGLVSELLHAVHVEQGADYRELIVVRMADDPDRYVDTYRMRMESVDGRDGVTVYRDDAGTPLRRFELVADIELASPGTRSVLLAEGHHTAVIRMIFVRTDHGGKQADEASIQIDTRVPLSRLE